MLQGNNLSSKFQLGRGEEHIKFIEDYLKANKLFRDYTNPEQDPMFTEV